MYVCEDSRVPLVVCARVRDMLVHTHTHRERWRARVRSPESAPSAAVVVFCVNYCRRGALMLWWRELRGGNYRSELFAYRSTRCAVRGVCVVIVCAVLCIPTLRMIWCDCNTGGSGTGISGMTITNIIVECLFAIH